MPKGAFTPDANEALRANDLHVKSMQRCDRQSCGAIRENEAARITRHKSSVWRAIRANRASWKIWTLADIRVALINQELALEVTSLLAEAENQKQQWRTK